MDTVRAAMRRFVKPELVLSKERWDAILLAPAPGKFRKVVLRRGRDHDLGPQSLKVLLNKAARERGVEAIFRTLDDGRVVIVVLPPGAFTPDD